MRDPKHIQLSIPQPCQQGRITMHRAGENLFCGQCQKVIIDFSRMSDAEIGRVMALPNAPTCGRFRRDQLERPIALGGHAPRPAWPRLAAGALLLLLAMPHAVLAQAPPQSASVTQAQTGSAKATPATSGDDSLFVLEGRLIHADFGMPLNFASVTCMAPAVEVQANDSGHFEMRLPRALLSDTLDLQIAWEGDLHAVRVSIDRQQPRVEVTLALQMQEMLVDGIMISSPPPASIPAPKPQRKRR